MVYGYEKLKYSVKNYNNVRHRHEDKENIILSNQLCFFHLNYPNLYKLPHVTVFNIFKK